MTALLIIIAAIVLLLIGYVFYGSWLAKQWGIDPKRQTPAQVKADGMDYVVAKPVVLIQRSYPGCSIRLGASIPVVRTGRYILRRTSGLRFSICLCSE